MTTVHASAPVSSSAGEIIANKPGGFAHNDIGGRKEMATMATGALAVAAAYYVVAALLMPVA